MRALAVALAAVALTSGPSAADDAADARRTVGLFVDAIFVDDPAIAVELMAGTVAFDLAAPACAKPYQAPGKVSGKARAALAACLVELHRASSTIGEWTIGASPITASIAMYHGDLVLELVRVKGRLRVAAVRFTPVPAEEIAAARAEEAKAAATAPPPPPPPPPTPVTLAPAAFAVLRIAGDATIVPDDVTRTEIQRSGKERVMVPIKICLDVGGKVDTVRVLKPSGFPAYDRKLEGTIRTWTYRPFVVDGRPAPACGLVNIVYRQT